MKARGHGEKAVDSRGKVLVHHEPAGGGGRAQSLPPKGTTTSGFQGEKGLTAQTDLQTSVTQQAESGRDVPLPSPGTCQVAPLPTEG